jgi:hypothetical protein
MVQGVQQAPQAPSYAPAGIQVPANISSKKELGNMFRNRIHIASFFIGLQLNRDNGT